jgi:hypothetical protein
MKFAKAGKNLSIISLGLQVVLILVSFRAFILTKFYLFDTPILPKNIGWIIGRPYLILLLTLIPFLAASAYLYVRKAFALCIGIGMLMLIWQYLVLDILQF